MVRSPAYAVVQVKKGRFFWVVWPWGDDWQEPLGEGYERTRLRAEKAARQVAGQDGVAYKDGVAKAFLIRRDRAAHFRAKAQERRDKQKKREAIEAQRLLALALKSWTRRVEEERERAEAEEAQRTHDLKKRVCWSCHRVASLLVSLQNSGAKVCALCLEERKQLERRGRKPRILVKPAGIFGRDPRPVRPESVELLRALWSVDGKPSPAKKPRRAM